LQTFFVGSYGDASDGIPVGDVFVNGSSVGGGSGMGAQSVGVVVWASDGRAVFAVPVTAGKQVVVRGVCAGPDVAAGAVFLYVVGTSHRASFGGVVTGTDGLNMAAFVWKLAMDLTTVNALASSSPLSAAVSCAVLVRLLGGSLSRSLPLRSCSHSLSPSFFLSHFIRCCSHMPHLRSLLVLLWWG
jgi:hypothetical protein